MSIIDRAAWTAPLAALALAACNPAEPPQNAPQSSAGEAASAAAIDVSSDVVPATSSAPTPHPRSAAGSPPPSEKGEQGARAVLLTWARALEHGNYGQAWQQFRDPPSTEADFSKWWSRYRTITVALSDGTVEGGAGSQYYTSRATLTGLTRGNKPYRLEGDVVLRRVNDVDGATPEQLRWHIERAVLENAAPQAPPAAHRP